MSDFIPTTLLTGYLGSGKTTFIEHILSEDHGLNLVIVVQNLDRIGIKEGEILGAEEHMLRLANGCICIEAGENIVTTLHSLLQREESPQHIIVEVGAVADPVKMLLKFNRSVLRNFIEVDSILAVVDAEQIISSQGEAERPIVEQLQLADTVIINKIDLINPEDVKKVERWVQSVVGKGRVFATSYSKVSARDVLGHGQYSPQQAFNKGGHGVHLYDADSAHLHEHDEASLVFSTWTWTSDRPLSLALLRTVLTGLSMGVFRGQGRIISQEFMDTVLRLEMVGKRVRLTMGGPVGDVIGSEITLVGSRDALNSEELTRLLDSTCAALAEQTESFEFTSDAVEWIRETGKTS